MKGFKRMFIANFKEFIRDRAGLFWLLAFPVVFIGLFGLLFAGESQASGFNDFDFVFPGIMAMALMQLGLFGAMNFLSLRENKVIKSLSVTPLSKMALLSSEILLKILIGFAQSSIILTIGILVFGIEVTNPLYLIYFFVLIGSMVFVSLGYMLITFATSIESGSGIAQVAQISMMFLAGIFFPVELLPDLIQPVVRVIPLTYLADGFRQVIVGLPGNYPMAVNLSFLIGWLVITSAVTMKFWRWE